MSQSDLVAAIGTFVLFACFGFVLVAAYVGEREPAVRALVLLVMAGVDALLVFLGGLFRLSGSISPELGEGMSSSQLSAIDPDAVMRLLPEMGLLWIVCGIAGFLLLMPPVRRLIARMIPVDPDRLVHVVALQYAMYVILIAGLTAQFVPLLAEGDGSALAGASGSSPLGFVALLWSQNLGFVLIAVLGVGLWVRRSGAEVKERLGLNEPFNWRWWLGVTVVALAASWLTDQVWRVVDPTGLGNVQRISEALFGPAMKAGLLGALTLGLSAGLGEEMLFRGAAQPRLGLVFTSFLFGAVHTQYTISPALLQVFAVGLLLGITRRRKGTLTAIAVHSTYNLILALLAIYGPQ